MTDQNPPGPVEPHILHHALFVYWKWLVLITVILASIVIYAEFSTGGYDEERLTRFACVEGTSKTLAYMRCDSVFEDTKSNKNDEDRILECEERENINTSQISNVSNTSAKQEPEPNNNKKCVLTDRYRLDFWAFQDDHPDIASRVAFLRDRVRDLESENKEFADRALDLHLASVLISFILFLIVVLFKTSPDAESPTSSETLYQRIWATLLQFSTKTALIAALFLALTQTFSFHTQFKAAKIAERAYDGLNVQIDSYILNLAARKEQANNLSTALSKELSDKVVEWGKEFTSIRSNFAIAYGSAFSMLEQPPGLGS